MPRDDWGDAIKEAFASAPSNSLILHTLEISHPDIESIFLIRDRKDWTLTLEGAGGDKLFTACGFQIQLPQSGENGASDLPFSIDNIDQVSDFIDEVKESTEPVTVTYRPYLASDTTEPQMDPPLILELTDISVTDVTVTAKASFFNLLTKPFLTELYTRDRFPGLGNF